MQHLGDVCAMAAFWHVSGSQRPGCIAVPRSGMLWLTGLRESLDCREVLVMVMRKHQRYFPVYASDDSLMPAFVTVANGAIDPQLVTSGERPHPAPVPCYLGTRVGVEHLQRHTPHLLAAKRPPSSASTRGTDTGRRHGSRCILPPIE